MLGKVYGTMVKTKKGKIVLYLCLDDYERQEYLLEKGKVPPEMFKDGNFTIVVR